MPGSAVATMYERPYVVVRQNGVAKAKEYAVERSPPSERDRPTLAWRRSAPFTVCELGRTRPCHRVDAAPTPLIAQLEQPSQLNERYAPVAVISERAAD